MPMIELDAAIMLGIAGILIGFLIRGLFIKTQAEASEDVPCREISDAKKITLTTNYNRTYLLVSDSEKPTTEIVNLNDDNEVVVYINGSTFGVSIY